MTIHVHPNDLVGPVRPLQGVNLGPIDRRWNLDFSEEYRRSGVSSVRLHDAPIQMLDVADLHCIFPCPRADPDDPTNYHFACTDDYLEKIREAGADIYFRLGESIEKQPTKRYVDPSEWTPEAMARVCANIVRHYNKGWANGFEWGIEYWEFWNEPDNGWSRPPAERTCWTAGTELFLDFYRAVAPAVKAADPAAKVGLAGFTGGIQAWVDADDLDDPDAWGGWGTVVTRVAREGIPADFVSWHTYPDHWTTVEALAAKMRRRLDDIGLVDAESHLTEWGYNPSVAVNGEEITFMRARRERNPDVYEAVARVANGPAGAAHVFGVLARLQDAPVEVAHLYTGVTLPFGLFAPVSGRAHLKYHGLELFGALARAGQRVRVDSDDSDVAVLAVVSEADLRIGVAYLGPGPTKLALSVESPSQLIEARWLGHGGWQPIDVVADPAGGLRIDLPAAGLLSVVLPR
jgi:hypothetical protein